MSSHIPSISHIHLHVHTHMTGMWSSYVNADTGAVSWGCPISLILIRCLDLLKLDKELGKKEDFTAHSFLSFCSMLLSVCCGPLPCSSPSSWRSWPSHLSFAEKRSSLHCLIYVHTRPESVYHYPLPSTDTSHWCCAPPAAPENSLWKGLRKTGRKVN